MFAPEFAGGSDCPPSPDERFMTNRANLRALLAALSAICSAVGYADDAAAPAPTEPPAQGIVISAPREQQEPYRVPTVDSLGPLGATPVLDTPYTVGILTQ